MLTALKFGYEREERLGTSHMERGVKGKLFFKMGEI